MYRVFVNEKVICFTDSEKKCKQFQFQMTLHFYSNELLPYLFSMINGRGEINVIVVLKDFEFAFKEFQNYFKIIKAAGGIVKNENGGKLFIYRLDKWDLPKGKIEKGEGIQAAAIREIEEECGITDLTIQKQLQDTYHIYEHKGEIILKQTYWFELTSSFKGELVPQLEENITKVEWLTDAEIETKVMVNTYASIKELL